MKNEIRDKRWIFRGALPASLVLHLVIAALVIFGLPISFPQPKEEQAITVDLVPPAPLEKAKVEPSPPAEEPRPEEPQETSVETPPPTSSDASRQGPSPMLRPVFQFGEMDIGPREAPQGNSAKYSSASPTAQQDLNKQDVAKPPAVTAVEGINEAPQPEAPETPEPKPMNDAEAQGAVTLQEAKTLFSQTATGDPTSTTAMREMPRGVRAGRLCVTELREQLLHALPPYFPELLPSHRLEDGTAIEISRTAFRANRRWYNLNYRCEVDMEVTKVVAFAFHVGEPVPRSEWKRRGLPSE